MPDYREILNDTIGNLVDKAREIAASDAVTGIVDKVKTAAEESGVSRVYEQGSARAKVYARIAKLTMELNGAHEELKGVYTEIGKLYYELAKDTPEGSFAPLFAQADEIGRGIAEREAEVKGLKEGLGVDQSARGIEVDIADFEQIVDATGSDGAGDTGEK